MDPSWPWSCGAEDEAGVETQPGSPEGPQAKQQAAGRAVLRRVEFSRFCSCTLCGNAINVTWELSIIYNPHVPTGSMDQMFQS